MNKDQTKKCPQCKNSLHESAFGWYFKVCNGCGEFNKRKKSHTQDKLEPEAQSEWKKELARIWDTSWSVIDRTRVYREIQSFVCSLLASQRRDLLQELLNEVEGIKKDSHQVEGGADGIDRAYISNGFNQALTAFADLIKAKLKL